MRRNHALFTGMTGGMTMRSLLIKDTTKEERMAIIEESVGVHIIFRGRNIRRKTAVGICNV